MTPPSYTTIDERSSFVVKRRMRKRPDPAEEPAITILPPEPSVPSDYFRSSSPGVYKAAPTKAANSKGASSFVILGEMLNTPVQSRPASPSGRVSPFRGKGFKSPAVSRAASPDPSKRKAAPPKKPIPPAKPKFKTDIGLPPKSPKKVKPRPLKSTVVQKTNLGVDGKTKPNRTPRPSRKPLSVAAKKSEKPSAEEIVIGVPPKQTDMNEVSEALGNLVSDAAEEVNTSAAEVAETEESELKVVDAEAGNGSAAEESVPSEAKDEEESEPASGLAEGSDDANGVGKSADEAEKEQKKESEKLIPCFQPDKCHIAPPTMASPSPIIASAINAPSTTSGSAVTKTTESIETAQASTVTTTSLNALSSAVTISGNLARKSRGSGSTPSTLAVPAITPSPAPKEDEKIQSASPGDKPDNASPNPAENSGEMPPHSHLSGAVAQTKKDSTNGAHGDVITTTDLIKVDSELELLSANSLRDSPPRRQLNPAWSEERLVNGDVPSAAENRSKFRRFLSSLWRLVKYILCCQCILDRCRRAACCKCNRCRGDGGKSSCLPRLSCCSCCGRLSAFKGCCGRSNCCKCRKPKCCEGSRCCRGNSKPPQEKRKCCAKMNCKNCCSNVRNCCSNCGAKVNNFCRAVFCLNTMCCQRCLRKCCKPCHKLKCCQTGGCCSCFNPGAKRPPKLDKRASTQSKSGKENLDPVLVEHMSLMKAAIPVLPTCLAILCLVLNLIFPGSGTLLSGLFCLCFGKPRFSVTDSAKNRVGSFCVNLVIGVAQLFTIVFCLVGWGWSIWWGVIMYRLASRYAVYHGHTSREVPMWEPTEPEN